ncbi:hypothetical protein EQM14_15150 [Caproiciproducens sp. NJN-50]|uniref:hypothetical protein n=1 Tax=Caproiciproducens sp. NJN-50 TaxID=2507162 RepID=UPI000FFE0D0B|nr:hypothetical protein [Caproiciproducens sp. NJN-50]QAT50995.1 hypothetical protein EQM14_15150 [Caproiciproducens sp. NJN-50]
MQKKQVKILLILIQTLLIGMQFLPVGMAASSTPGDKEPLSVFGMIHRYAGMGFSNNALVYLLLSCLLPILTAFLLIFLRERYNFGMAACLSAFYMLAAACFFTAAKRKMVDSVAMTGLHYFIILVSLLSLALAAWGFCICVPSSKET